MICAHFTGKIIIGRCITNLRFDHGRIVVHVIANVSDHLPPVFVVAVFSSGEIGTETSVITSSISFDITDIIASQLKIYTMY